MGNTSKATADLTLPETEPAGGSVVSRMIGAKKRRWDRIPIAVDPDQADKLQAARAQRAAAEYLHKQKPADSVLLDDYEAKKAKVAELAESMAVVWITVSSIGASASADLVDECQPDAAVRKKFRDQGNEGHMLWDPDKYVPARIAATVTLIEYPDGSVDTSIEPDQVREVFASRVWSSADQNDIFEAAQKVDITSNLAPLDQAGNA